MLACSLWKLSFSSFGETNLLRVQQMMYLPIFGCLGHWPIGSVCRRWPNLRGVHAQELQRDTHWEGKQTSPDQVIDMWTDLFISCVLNVSYEALIQQLTLPASFPGFLQIVELLYTRRKSLRLSEYQNLMMVSILGLGETKEYTCSYGLASAQLTIAPPNSLYKGIEALQTFLILWGRSHTQSICHHRKRCFELLISQDSTMECNTPVHCLYVMQRPHLMLLVLDYTNTA